jgi:2-deoxy-D-gluconate 3-dehydrogenase
VVTPPAPDETATMVVAAGRKLTAIAADLGSTEPIARIVAEAGEVDIIRRADSTEFAEDGWDAVMDTNLKTAFFLSQAAARRWVAEGRGGKIINLASMLSFQGGCGCHLTRPRRVGLPA